MRVTHVISGLEPHGAQMALCRLLESVDREVYDQSVIVLGSKGRLSHRVEQLGVQLTHLEQKRPGIRGLVRLHVALKETCPDIVQGWMYHANLASLVYRGQHGPALVWGIRHTPSNLSRETKTVRALIRAGAVLSRIPDRIVYNAHVSAEVHERLGYSGARREVIANGFDTAVFKPDSAARERLRAEWQIGRDQLAIGIVARWHPMKDHESVIRAAQLYCRHAKTPAVIVMAGEGMDWKNEPLLRIIKEYGVEGCCRLCGPREDIQNVYAALDILTLASAWGEGFPNVIGEAMAAGVPCVATDVGDAARLVGSAGLTVRCGDSTALCGAWLDLAKIGESGRRALGRRARKRIESEFGIRAMSQRYLRLYRQLHDLRYRAQ